MRKGTHTIRSGFTTAAGAGVTPRRYSLDNGNYRENMKVTHLEVFPIGTDPANRDSLASVPIFFVLSTSEAGAIPTATTSSPDEYGAVLELRPSDSRQIGWGILSPAYGYVWSYIDPDHIIPEDLYVNAWSISSGGSINPVYTSIGFIIKMKQVKQSGSEGLLQQIKEAAVEY